MKTTLLMILFVGMTVAVQAAVSVSDVVCTPRFPWNGKVDIDYTVGSDNPNEDICVLATAFDKDANVPIRVVTLTGEGAAQQPVKPGRHRLTWDAAADHPGLATTALRVDLVALSGLQNNHRLYLIIDLSGGPEADSYPVSYLESVPEGGWSDEYKTTKLVLRRILPGTFRMGSPAGEYGRNNDETLHYVTLTQPYYIGVFEMTQKQWELVMGENPSRYIGDARPVENLSYQMIRGSSAGLGWPIDDEVDADSLLGRLRKRTGLRLDIPTEAQWECACRAGTDSALPNGKDVTEKNVAEIARYAGNWQDGKGGYSGAHTTVGSYLPNNWGLYDVIGNVCEACRDGWGSLSAADAVDPKGSADGRSRANRSCWAVDGVNLTRSARRSGGYNDTRYGALGCRLSLTVLGE